MRVFRHGLVIGKFYPPHAGHEYLIRAAAQAAQQVTVVVMAADVENIALSQRVAWLTEIFATQPQVRITGVMDNAAIDYHSESVWEEHVAAMRRGIEQVAAARSSPAGPVDAVFTSENYGAELARRFDAAAVCLDQVRALYPVSGTAVRAHPADCWQHLAPCVRESLCYRLVIVGAESTGKSTLAAALSARLRGRGGAWATTQWVAEYGREYTVTKLAVHRAQQPRDAQPADMHELLWESDEFTHIAAEQCRRESHAARHGGPVLVCDTDAFATGIWHERYRQARSNEVEALTTPNSPRRGYILSNWADVPFTQDGLRDGEHIREWMHERFITRLDAARLPWTLVSGSLEARVEQSLHWLEQQLTSAWHFAEPLEQRSRE